VTAMTANALTNSTGRVVAESRTRAARLCEIVKFVDLNPRARPGESLRARNLQATVAFHPLFGGRRGPGAPRSGPGISALGYVFRLGSASMEEMAGFLATVLICDDEPSLRELIRVSLDGAYSFAEADDGEKSLEIARRLKPDVVILDIMMPRRNGLEVLSELRRDEGLAATAVIVLTAQPAMRDEALRHGADVVMVKPFEPHQITAAVEEVLANRR